MLSLLHPPSRLPAPPATCIPLALPTLLTYFLVNKLVKMQEHPTAVTQETQQSCPKAIEGCESADAMGVVRDAM